MSHNLREQRLAAGHCFTISFLGSAFAKSYKHGWISVLVKGSRERFLIKCLGLSDAVTNADETNIRPSTLPNMSNIAPLMLAITSRSATGTSLQDKVTLCDSDTEISALHGACLAHKIKSACYEEAIRTAIPQPSPSTVQATQFVLRQLGSNLPNCVATTAYQLNPEHSVKNDTMLAGEIAGIVIGSIVGVVLLIIVSIKIKHSSRKRGSAQISSVKGPSVAKSSAKGVLGLPTLKANDTNPSGPMYDKATPGDSLVPQPIYEKASRTDLNTEAAIRRLSSDDPDSHSATTHLTKEEEAESEESEDDNTEPKTVSAGHNLFKKLVKVDNSRVTIKTATDEEIPIFSSADVADKGPDEFKQTLVVSSDDFPEGARRGFLVHGADPRKRRRDANVLVMSEKDERAFIEAAASKAGLKRLPLDRLARVALEDPSTRKVMKAFQKFIGDDTLIMSPRLAHSIIAEVEAKKAEFLATARAGSATEAAPNTRAPESLLPRGITETTGKIVKDAAADVPLGSMSAPSGPADFSHPEARGSIETPVTSAALKGQEDDGIESKAPAASIAPAAPVRPESTGSTKTTMSSNEKMADTTDISVIPVNSNKGSTEGIPLELTDTTGRTKEAPNVKNEEPDAKVMNVDPTQMEKGDPTQIENALVTNDDQDLVASDSKSINADPTLTVPANTTEKELITASKDAQDLVSDNQSGVPEFTSDE